MADNTKFVSLAPKQLTEPLSTSGTTLYANNLNFDLDGDRALALSDLGDYGWIVIEPRSAQNREICKVTGVSGTQLTIVRGYKPFAPYDQDTATWAKTHSVGVSFVFTNAPQMYDEFAVKDNDETITGTWTFTESVMPRASAQHTYGVGEEEFLATKRYVDGVVTGGAADANTTTKGLVEEATAAELTAGAAAGGTSARLFTNPSTLAAHIQSGAWLFATTGGTADAITATLTPAITAFSHGMILCVHNTTANNAGATFNPNGLGAKAIYKYAGGSAIAIEANDMKALYHYILLYDSDADVFLLVNPSNGTLTAPVMTAATSFFASTAAQPLKTTVTAGQDLDAKELVAIESDGKVYRTRPTSLPGTNRLTTASAGEQFGSSGMKRMLQTPTSTVNLWIGKDDQAGAFIDMYKPSVDTLYGTPTVNAATNLSSAAGSFYDCILTSDTLIASYRLDTGTGRLIAVTDADGTPSAGAELSLGTADGGGVSDTSVAGTYIGFRNSGANLVGHKVTISGNTLTDAASATLLSGGSLVPLSAKRFTGTDYILVLYGDGSSNLMAVVGEYNPSTGAWTSVGTPITVSASEGTSANGYYIDIISSTKAFIGYQGSSDIKAAIVTRGTTTTITCPTPTSIITSVTVPGVSSFAKINNRAYLLGAETNAGGKLQIVGVDRDYSTVAAVGSPLTNGASTNLAIAGCPVSPTRVMTVYQTGATDSAVSVEDLGTNLDGVLGFIDAAVASNATEKVITSGYVSGLSGLTPGSYFTALNGALTTNESGTLPVSATTLAPRPKVRLILNALSATTGIKI